MVVEFTTTYATSASTVISEKLSWEIDFLYWMVS
jgi:hypothetical protein